MTRSDERTVRPDYWYTESQIGEVGKAWQREENNRIFKVPAISYTTALTQEDVNSITHYPTQIMLPYNKGNSHWTAFAVTVNRGVSGNKNVDIKFTDSLGNVTAFNKLPANIQDEANRIADLFGQGANIRKSAYQHSWKQEDGASCGPYSLANAERALAGKGAEPNPGRVELRKSQLNMMSEPVAYKGCSYNNKIDEVLRHWILTRVSEGASLYPEGAEEVMLQYANSSGESFESISQIFAEEYGLHSGAHRIVPLQTRIRELVSSDPELQQQLGRNPNFQNDREELYESNSMEKIEAVKEILAKKVGENKSFDYMAEIINELSQGHGNEAINLLKQRGVSGEELNQCEVYCAEIISTRDIEKDYSQKLAAVADSYKEIYYAQEEISNAKNSQNMLANLAEKTEAIRERIAADIGEEASYEVMGSLVNNLFSKSHGKDKAIAAIQDTGMFKESVVQCISNIEEILAAKDQPHYDEALEKLLKSYEGIAHFTKEIDTQTRDVQTIQDSLRIFDTSLGNAEAHLQSNQKLLAAAIKRNNANLVEQVGYVIKDFCASIAEVLTGGKWVPDHKKIAEIKAKLSPPPKGMSNKAFEDELENIKNLLGSKQKLQEAAANLQRWKSSLATAKKQSAQRMR